MLHHTRVSINSTARLFLVLFLLLPFTILLAPTLTAQGDPELLWNPVPATAPAMHYQPPLDADDLNDFLPPDYAYLNAPIASTSPTTPTLPPVTPTIPVPSAPITTVITLPETGGGLFFHEQQVAVIVEDDTFSQAVDFHFISRPVPTYPITHTNTISNPASSRTLLSFQVETVDSVTGAAISAFEHPTRLVIDMRSLMAGLNPVYTDFWLAYRDPNNPAAWHEVPVIVHQTEGLISAEVRHFSEWATGVRPERWNPSWTPPAVSEFSGAATYSYPIDVPPGRNGLQPNVTLSYNSRGLDGHIQDAGFGNVAHGWSLAEISIVREDVRLKNDWGIPYADLQHRFRLVLNGTGHRLIAAGTAKWGGTRFQAEDAPDLYIELHTLPSDPTQQRLYWSVITADGTYYRLGYSEDAHSEESQQVPNTIFMQLKGAGNEPINGVIQAGIAWYVDLVVDAFGNRMAYTYYRVTTTETIDFFNNGSWLDYDLTTHKSRIENINYNYPVETITLPPGPSTPYPTSTPGSRVAFRAPGNNTAPVQNIYVFHGNLSSPIKEYRLGAINKGYSSYTCENEDPDTEEPRITHTRVITAVQLFTGTNDDPNDNDGAYALPPVTFDYGENQTGAYPHYIEQGGPCFGYYYLKEVDNGYGGKITFAYASDNRQVGDYTTPDESCNTNFPHTYPWDYPEDCWLPYGQYEWPEIGFSYYVTATTISDGINPPTTTTYSYDTPCYQQKNEGVYRCAFSDWNSLPEFSTIMGFLTTTVTYKGFAGENLTRRVTTFSQADYHYLGWATQSESYAWNSTLGQFQRVSKTANSLAVDTSMSPAYFSYVSESESYQYDPADNNHFLATKQLNQYSTSYQGGQQWGRLTQQDLYTWANNQWTFQQRQANRYRTRTTDDYWLIRPYAQGVYTSGNVAKQLTLLYYDDATNNPDTQTLTQGALTLSREVLINSPIPGTSTRWYTSDTRTSYDDYGNLETIKSNTAYGEVGLNGIWWSHSVLPGTGTEQETSIAYDSTSLYPVSVTQKGAEGSADDLTTTFQVYGFNGVALDGWQKQTGLLKQVTNPNGLLTIYEYDPFGRLVATYENDTDRGLPGEYLDGHPLVRYRYWDNSWNQGVVYLEPGNNKPFMIATQTRPGDFTIANDGYLFKTLSFFDGLGRVIQEQNTYQEVHDLDASSDWLAQKDVVTSTRYNAQGLAVCQTVPYAVALYNQRATFPDSAYVPGDCTNYDHTTTAYDTLGRPLTVTTPGNKVTSYAYDVVTDITSYNHNRLSVTNVTDANNHVIQQYQNALGQLVLVREYTDEYPSEDAYADTRYRYGILGNLIEVGTSTPGSSQPISWSRLSEMTYDAFGRKVTMDDPDMGEWSYTYDALGNLKSQTDALGQSLCFWVDRFNRPTEKREDADADGCESNDSLLAQTSYFAAGTGASTGQVQQVLWPDNSNKETFTYDPKGRLSSHIRWIGGTSYTMGYGNYDKLDRPQTLTYPNNESVTITYDHEGEDVVSAGGTNLFNGVTYDRLGQMVMLFRGNYVRTTYNYFGASGDFRLENSYIRRYYYGVTTDLLDFDYAYDNVGNITHIFEDVSNDSQWFEYDELNRLTSAYTTGGPAPYNHTYTYDKLGNLQSRNETVNGTSTTYDLVYTASAQDQPHAIDEVVNPGRGGGPVYDLAYDANGNMIKRVDHLAGKTYTQGFDVENRLVTVTLSSGTPMTTTFRYDTGGQRTQTISYDSSTSRTVTQYPFPHYEVEWVQNWQLCELCGEGEWAWVTTQTTTRSTYFLAGQAIATRVNGTLYHLHSDHLGSTSLMTYGNGQANPGTKVSGSETRYLPYGGYRTTPTAGLTERGYTGHHENEELGLTYMNARFYVPNTNRFLTPDSIIPQPTDPQSHNRYSYALNNPMTHTRYTSFR